MAKIIFFVLIGVIVYWRFRSHRALSAPRKAMMKPGEDMVRCLHCSVYVPRSAAAGGESGWFCSDAHQREYRR